jgi:hypothetical protein
MYNYISQLCRSNPTPCKSRCGTGKGEAMHRKYRRLELDGGQTYDCSAD